MAEPETAMTIEQFGAVMEAAILEPEVALTHVQYFYELEEGLGIEQQNAHREIAQLLGRSMDASVLKSQNVLARLAAGERIQFVQVPAMRAGDALIDPNPETNLLSSLEAITKGQFSVVNYPLGVTRHKEEGEDIEFHRYHPNGTSQVHDHITLDPTASITVIVEDFGSATGTTGRDIAKIVIDEFKVKPEQVIISAVIGSDLAQTACAEVVPAENVYRQVVGGTNEKGWIVSVGTTPGNLQPVARPKDWGAMMFGQEPNLRGIYGFNHSDSEFTDIYIEHTQRLIQMHRAVLALNNDPRLLQYFETQGKAELLRWYDERFLGAANFAPELRAIAHSTLMAA